MRFFLGIMQDFSTGEWSSDVSRVVFPNLDHFQLCRFQLPEFPSVAMLTREFWDLKLGEMHAVRR